MSFAAGMKTIVVATDLKGQPEAALEYARKLAGEYGSRIVGAYAPDPISYAAVDTVPGGLLERLSEEARAALDKLGGDLLREGIHSHSEIRQGVVAEILVDVARQYQAGLMVIGTKGISGAGPAIVGAIAEQLVRLSPCPVLAVAADWNAGEYHPTPGGPVLLAIEHNEATHAAVDAAYSLAEKFHRTLLVLHAYEPAAAPFYLYPAATTLEEYGLNEGGSFPVRFTLKNGIPADVIAEAIAKYQPSILVAGVKRTSDTSGPHGTAFSLLACSRVPVLCVPPEPTPTFREQKASLAEQVSPTFSRLERFAGFEVSTVTPGLSEFRSIKGACEEPAAVER
jgi:nucleotide-binding universal stress UspA family protein